MMNLWFTFEFMFPFLCRNLVFEGIHALGTLNPNNGVSDVNLSKFEIDYEI